MLKDVLGNDLETFVSGEEGNPIFKYSGNWAPRDQAIFAKRPDEPGLEDALAANWA